jgi:hypothetical protein
MWLAVTLNEPEAPQRTPWSPEAPLTCVTPTDEYASVLVLFTAVPAAVAAVYSQNAAPPEPPRKHRTRASVVVTVPPELLVPRIEIEGVVPAASEHDSMVTTGSVSVQVEKVIAVSVALMLVALAPLATVAVPLTRPQWIVPVAPRLKVAELDVVFVMVPPAGNATGPGSRRIAVEADADAEPRASRPSPRTINVKIDL